MTVFNSLPSTRIVIILALIAMLVLSFISFTKISRLNQLHTHVNHSNIIKLTLQETYADLSDADSELNKYILTSDISYQKRMIELENTIYSSIGKLKSLTASDTDQLKSINILDSLTRRRFALMNVELRSHNTDYKEIASKITDCNTQIIVLIHVLKENENKSIIALEGSLQKYKVWTPITIFAVKILVVIFLIIAYLRTDAELTIKRGLQKELEEQVQFITAILNNSVDIIIVVDTDAKLVMANKKAAALLGITDAMIGKNIFSLFPTAENSKSHEAILQASKGKYVHIPKHQAVSINLILESFFIPLYRNNEINAVVVIHHDITALTKASDELENNNEMLRKINLDLEQFAFVASHDLQAPLRKISIYSSLAEKAKNDSTKMSDYLSRISNTAERMAKLVKDILDFSRSTFNISETESVDLNVVYRQVVQDLEVIIEEKQAIIHAASLPMVEGYAQQLSQVFLNLIHNALKFCDQKPVIVIQCKTEDGFYIITVSDNGIGFDQSYENQIFDVFKRVPNKQGHSGTGIGLAVCKKIITNHRGSISVKSELGKGTTFEIRLPVTYAAINHFVESIK